MEHTTTFPATVAQTEPAAAPSWLDRELYPFTSRFFASDAGRIHYVDEGAGPRTFLFVHGTPSWSFEWRHALAALSVRARVVAIDHLGFGLSEKPANAGYAPEDHARRLLAFVRALDLREIVLVVHDFGGPIGLPVLFEEPARVRALVVLNSWAWPHGDDPRVRRLAKFVGSPIGRALYLWANASPRWLVPMSFGDRSRFSPAVHRHYLAPFAKRSDRLAVYALARALAGSDPYYARLFEQRAKLRSVPSALIWGERDPAFGASYLARFRELLPEALVYTLPGAGHFPQEEAPDAVLAALRETLSRD